MLKRSLALHALICVCLFAPGMFAQSSQPGPSSQSPPSSEGWRVQVIPYLWGSDFKGRVGIGDRSADVDASFRDLFRELNFAFMGLIEANKDKFTTFTDIVYMNLSDERATPGPLFSSVDAVDKTLIPGAKNAELKALLVKVRPAFVAHLEHARHLQMTLGK